MLETPLVTHLVALSPLVALAALLAAAADAGAAPAADDLDPARIKAVAAMLPEKPAGLGPTITDRAASACVRFPSSTGAMTLSRSRSR
jgi:hypothetical protein